MTIYKSYEQYSNSNNAMKVYCIQGTIELVLLYMLTRRKQVKQLEIWVRASKELTFVLRIAEINNNDKDDECNYHDDRHN